MLQWKPRLTAVLICLALVAVALLGAFEALVDNLTW